MDTFGTFPSVRLLEGVRLIEVVKIVRCLLTINIQRLPVLCTVIKLYVVKEAIQSSSSLPTWQQRSMVFQRSIHSSNFNFSNSQLFKLIPISPEGLENKDSTVLGNSWVWFSFNAFYRVL